MGIAKKVAITAALLALPAASSGQGGTCGRNGGIRTPDLGFSTISCEHCTIDQSPRRVTYRFGTEPRVGGISAAGRGKLREGDVLVAVNGDLITTEEATDRLSNTRRGERVRLTVRRGGRTQAVDVVAGEHCVEPPVPPTPPRPPRAPSAPRAPLPPEAPGAPRAPDMAPPPPPLRAPLPPQPPRAPRAPHAPAPPLPPLPPPPPEILPAGWFGFGISCDECGVHRNDDDVSMYFGEAPVVENVEPGSPAQRAGLRRGDRLTHVDGLALTTRQGARRFADIRPGQAVTWTYRRGSGAYTARTTAVRRPAAPSTPHAPGVPATPRAAQQVRYSGAVGSTDVEVRGAPVTITRDERTGETVIRSHDLTVRLRPDRP
ncbi:MAG TPA: PDZ domain-containing protein [Longimicrobium sp.]|nr:PDZ domain-containing protein [Longimicrobium sp.]